MIKNQPLHLHICILFKTCIYKYYLSESTIARDFYHCVLESRNQLTEAKRFALGFTELMNKEGEIGAHAF